MTGCSSSSNDGSSPGPDAGNPGDASIGDAASMDSGNDASPGGDGGIGIHCSGASPTFSNDVHHLLQGCGGELCHGGMAGGSWPYDALVNAPVSRDSCAAGAVIVKPGSLDESYLMNKLTGIGMCSGVRMPKEGAPLTANELQTIADWICQGAQNN